MKAVVVEKAGVMVVKEVPDPKVGSGEIRVAVQACGINHRDLKMREAGGYPHSKGDYIPGSDVVGVVEAVGEGVTRYQPGDQVIVCPSLSCGRCEACLSGRDSFCPEFRVLDGGYAEKIVVPERNVYPMVKGFSIAEAAALPLASLTAWHMLIGRAALQPGETVLVWGAGSGVGSFAIQIAKLHAARVIAVASSDEKLAKAKQLGADWLINHSTEDVAAQVKNYTDGRGVDVIFDHVGTAVWETNWKAIRDGGRWVNCGVTTGKSVNLSLSRLFARQISLLGSRMGSHAQFLHILKHAQQGRLKPVVDRTFPLSEAEEAHQWIKESRHFGKVVLVVRQELVKNN